MSDTRIKISADTSSIKQSLADLNQQLKSVGSSKVSILNRTEMNFLTKESKSALNDIKNQMEANRRELFIALKDQAKGNKTLQEEINLRKKTLDIIKKQVDLQKQASSIQTPNAGGGSGGDSGSGIGGMAGMFGKLNPAAMLGMGALGAGGFLLNRGMQARGVFTQGVNDRVALRGRGVEDINLKPELQEQATQAGMNTQSVRRARLQAMDVFGRAGATQERVIQRGAFERNYGVEQGTLGNIGAQLRGTMGGKGADKATMTIQASLISTGITDEIGPYLETAANMLVSINENGLTFSDSAAALLSTVAKSGQIAPERAGKMISGIDQSIKGSTGEANAFFQQVFGKAGIGGGSIGGAQAAIRSGGLFGADLDSSYLGDVDKRALKELGIGGRTMGKVAQGTVSTLDQLFGDEQEIGKQLKSEDKDVREQGAAKQLQRLSFVRQTFGLQNEVQAGEVSRLLKEAADPNTSMRRQTEIQKKVEKIQSGNTELGNLQSINKSIEGVHQILENKTINVQDIMGEKTAPIFNKMNETLLKLDTTMLSLMEYLGLGGTAGQAVEAGLSGKGVMSREDFLSATKNDPDKIAAFSEKFSNKYSENRESLSKLDPVKDKEEISRIKKEQSNLQDSFMNVPELKTKDPEILRGMSKDIQARNSEESNSFIRQDFKEMATRAAKTILSGKFPEETTTFYPPIIDKSLSKEAIGNIKSEGVSLHSTKENTDLKELVSILKQNNNTKLEKTKTVEAEKTNSELLSTLKSIANSSKSTSKNTQNINGVPPNTGKTI
ncbi:MAG: hypothetical protein MOGMAGMI_00273 [Candidatus Omnitrophica bacterium]|nr:hypothetical protein [Candidatus Omnitrophota bacterium]